MGDRSDELAALARDVLSTFRRLPECPRALSVSILPEGNIRIELYNRVFVISALVVDASMTTPEWCKSVLRLVMGVPGRHVEDVRRRAQVSAALTLKEIVVMQNLHSMGMLAEGQNPAWEAVSRALVEKGLVDILPAPETHHYALSDEGRDALAAHRA